MDRRTNLIEMRKTKNGFCPRDGIAAHMEASKTIRSEFYGNPGNPRETHGFAKREFQDDYLRLFPSSAHHFFSDLFLSILNAEIDRGKRIYGSPRDATRKRIGNQR